MAETPSDTYNSFCAECATLEATILTLEAVPSLDTLDALSAAKTRLDLVKNAMPELCSASERYEQEQKMLAVLATQAPRWAAATNAKVSALADVYANLVALFQSIDAYNQAHSSQMSVLTALNYGREFRIRYSSAPASLRQLVIDRVNGDLTALSKVTTFDVEGVEPGLPFE